MSSIPEDDHWDILLERVKKNLKSQRKNFRESSYFQLKKSEQELYLKGCYALKYNVDYIHNSKYQDDGIHLCLIDEKTAKKFLSPKTPQPQYENKKNLDFFSIFLGYEGSKTLRQLLLSQSAVEDSKIVSSKIKSERKSVNPLEHKIRHDENINQHKETQSRIQKSNEELISNQKEIRKEQSKSETYFNQVSDQLLDSRERHIYARKSLNFLLFSVPVIFLILVGVFYLHWNSSESKEPDLIPHEELAQLFVNSDSTSFKLLILPFKPDKTCRIENSEYEQQFLDRFNEIKARDSLNIDVRFVKNTTCLNGYYEAEILTNDPNIDMVIWGRYEEECDSETEICVNYSLSPTIQSFAQEIDNSLLKSSSDFHPLSSLRDLRNGYLQESIDEIIFWVVANYHYKNGDFKKSLQALKIGFDDLLCQTEVLHLNGDALLHINSAQADEEAIMSYAKIILCDLGMEVDSSFTLEELMDICYADNLYQSEFKEHSRLWGNIGAVLFRLQETEMTMQANKLSLFLDSLNSQIWGNLAESFRRIDENDSASYCLNKAFTVDTTPNRYAYLKRNGILQFELGEYSSALACFQVFLDQDSTDAEIWNYRGAAYKEKGLTSLSASSFEKAISIDSSYTLAWYNYGLMQIDLLNYSEAKASFDRVIELDPQDESALYQLGRLEENDKKALEYFANAVVQNPAFKDAWFEMGVILTNNHNFKDGLQAFENVVVLDSSHEKSWLNMAKIYYQVYDTVNCIQALQKCIELNQENHQAWSLQGNCMNAFQEYDLAYKCFKAAFELNENQDYLDNYTRLTIIYGHSELISNKRKNAFALYMETRSYWATFEEFAQFSDQTFRSEFGQSTDDVQYVAIMEELRSQF